MGTEDQEFLWAFAALRVLKTGHPWNCGRERGDDIARDPSPVFVHEAIP